MRVLVGSQASNLHGVTNRKNRDVDIWTDEHITKQKGVDAKVIPVNILNLLDTIEIDNNIIPTMDCLYTIKCSHLGFSNPMWNKHKLDVLHFESIGCKIKEDLYEALLSFWKTELTDKSFLSLNKNKENFFTDNVEYVVDHDYLHELVAYPNPPMYLSVLKENEQVMVDKSKFDMLPFEHQLRLFREEISVIAIERWLINPRVKGRWSVMQAYLFSLEKTITTLTKGWATDFIIRNLKHYKSVDYSYFTHTIETLN